MKQRYVLDIMKIVIISFFILLALVDVSLAEIKVARPVTANERMALERLKRNTETKLIQNQTENKNTEDPFKVRGIKTGITKIEHEKIESVKLGYMPKLSDLSCTNGYLEVILEEKNNFKIEHKWYADHSSAFLIKDYKKSLYCGGINDFGGWDYNKHLLNGIINIDKRDVVYKFLDNKLIEICLEANSFLNTAKTLAIFKDDLIKKFKKSTYPIDYEKSKLSKNQLVHYFFGLEDFLYLTVRYKENLFPFADVIGEPEISQLKYCLTETNSYEFLSKNMANELSNVELKTIEKVVNSHTDKQHRELQNKKENEIEQKIIDNKFYN